MENKSENIKVRIAPSPTGALHVGTAHTALFNFLFAKHYGGRFVMRIEDTDKERSEEKWEKDILENLKWLGLEWDEIYKQSERTGIYTQYIEKLLQEKTAFYCWHTQEELEQERKAQAKKKEAPRHICAYRDSAPDENEINTSIIRFKNTHTGKISFEDAVKGKISFTAELLGDFSIAKNISGPLYNFAVVVDDFEMKITHVLRGEDHIPNTPKQILLQRALGFNKPEYIHIPLILGADRSKLSKRHGATSVSTYAKSGYLPDTMFNFLSLLGWRPKEDGKEIMTSDQIIKEFAVEDIQKSPAIFDIEKLDWMNGQYLRKLDTGKFAELCMPYLKEAGLLKEELDTEFIKKAVSLEQTRVKKLEDIAEATEFFFKEPQYEAPMLIWKQMTKEELINILQNVRGIIKNIDEKSWNMEELEKLIMPEAEETGDRGKMLWPLRVALTGKKASPGPFEVMNVLGKEEVLKRIEAAIEKNK
ncbi:MAG: glutamate--tRNA ligase [Candidatus Spechtbacterales bacterium]